MTVDVLVVGGGPAGATAAALLARAGRRVALVEKARFPRRKVCGEFVAGSGIDALRRLLPGVDAELGPEVRRIALWAGAGALEAPLPAPYARTIARERLDPLLLEHAARCGAQLFQPAMALALERTGAGFVCRVAERRGAGAVAIRARCVVAAHGCWERGTLPTQAHRAPPRAGDLLAFKAHFGDCALPAGTIALIPYPGGYAGVVELGGGRATFACCIRRDALEALRREAPGLPAGESVLRCARRASRALDAAFARALREEPWLAAGPLRPGARAAYADGVYAVGNAAGEIHPITGEGIAMAIESACLLCDALDSPAAYQARWRAAFERRFWASALFARFCAHPRAAGWLRALRGPAPSLLAFAARLSGKG
jgi:flavin-dependent dehydrogenase